MDVTPCSKSFSFKTELFFFLYVAVGAFLAAFSIDVFLIPNNLIDGGVVGIAMILGKLTKPAYIPYMLIILNLPFLYFAYKQIGRTFVIHFFIAIILFALSLIFIHNFTHWTFEGDKLEVVVIGGAILGIGIGTIIRYGGCLDGTEILGLVISKKTGLTVGSIVLGCNILIFGTAGIVFQDWHPPLLSLITYMVVVKVMDAVIVGLDETKSVMIVSIKSKEVAERIMHELGLGLTVMYGRGGFSGEEKEILYVIAERLQLAELKEIIHQVDPAAFIAIENLHEVSYGQQNTLRFKKKSYLKSLMHMMKKSVQKSPSGHGQ